MDFKETQRVNTEGSSAGVMCNSWKIKMTRFSLCSQFTEIIDQCKRWSNNPEGRLREMDRAGLEQWSKEKENNPNKGRKRK